MRLTLILAGIFFLNGGCVQKSKITQTKKIRKKHLPNEVVKISENLYAEAGEVTNLDYREYLDWTKLIYGRESEEYIKALPDSNIWHREYQYGEPFFRDMNFYFRHPAFDEYPVVGVDLKQAKNFSLWRTNRNAEKLLAKHRIIKKISNPTENYHFSLDRYFQGEADWILQEVSEITFLEFRVPTENEWEEIAGGDSSMKLGIDTLNGYNQRILRQYGEMIYSFDYLKDHNSKNDIIIPRIPYITCSFSKNIYGLYHTFGNVSELVVDKSIVKGGSWKDFKNSLGIKKSEDFQKPTNWIGFRNICSFKTVNKNGS